MKRKPRFEAAAGLIGVTLLLGLSVSGCSTRPPVQPLIYPHCSPDDFPAQKGDVRPAPQGGCQRPPNQPKL